MTTLGSLIFYLVSFTLSSLLIYFAQFFRKKIKPIYILLVILGLSIPFVISGFRYGVGTDFFNYLGIYFRNINVSFKDYITDGNYELGFFLIMKVASFFNNDQLIFVISSFIILIFIYLSIEDNRENSSILLSYLIYIFVFFPISFNIIRQSIAISIILFAYKYIFKKDFKRFLILVTFASLFHITALLVIPVYFLFNYGDNTHKKPKKIYRSIFIIFVLVVSIFYEEFINILSNLKVFARYDIYAAEIEFGLNREFILKFLIFIVIMIFFRKKLIKINMRNEFYIYALIIDLIITYIGFFNPFVKRIALYFSVTSIFLLPSLLNIFKNRIEKFVAGWLLLIYAYGYFVIVYYILGYANVIPYRFSF